MVTINRPKFRRTWSTRSMRRGLHSSVQGACCLDIGFRHMFSALGSISFGRCMRRAVRLPPYFKADASPGVGSLVGGEFSQSLGAHRHRHRHRNFI